MVVAGCLFVCLFVWKSVALVEAALDVHAQQ